MKILKSSSTFIYSDMGKFLDLSSAFATSSLGYMPPYFSKRVKNYIKRESYFPLPSSLLDLDFFSKRITSLKQYPYIYMIEHLPFTLHHLSLSFSPKISLYESYEESYFKNLFSNSSNKKLMSNFFAIFENSPLEKKNPDLFYTRDISHLSLIDHHFSPPLIALDPCHSLIYPVKKILFSKRSLDITSSPCEISRRLYRDYFLYMKKKTILPLKQKATEFIEKDLIKWKSTMTHMDQKDHYFKIHLKNSLKPSSENRYYIDKYSFIAHGSHLYLGTSPIENPIIYKNKLSLCLKKILEK